MGLFDLFSNDTAEQAAQQRNQGLQQGYDALSSSYGRGRDALTTNYGNASNLYSGLIGSTAGGAKAYGDATGANGTAGLQSAMDTFKNSGQYGNYGFSLTNGLQALDRTHAAAGNLSSGNADADTLNYATGLANNTYNSYVAGLQPYLGANASAVSGAAGVDQGLGQGLNASYQGQGGAANANYTGQGASTAAATMNNYNVGKNQLGAILGVGQLAMGMPPTSFSGIGGAPTVGGTSLGGPNGPTPTSGGLFSMFG